jgi:hypothetical protein
MKPPTSSSAKNTSKPWPGCPGKKNAHFKTVIALAKPQKFYLLSKEIVPDVIIH